MASGHEIDLSCYCTTRVAVDDCQQVVCLIEACGKLLGTVMVSNDCFGRR